MKVGFASIYSWRPHVEHMYYLARLAEESGNVVSYLSCESDVKSCYSHMMWPESSQKLSCLRCRLGGIHSYTNKSIYNIGQLCKDNKIKSIPNNDWSYSSASTLGRFESDQDYQSNEFFALVNRLTEATNRNYIATLKWIEKEKLDVLCVFNGRIDATRGIIQAAQTLNIPFICYERTLFGDGLQLLPNENALGLNNTTKLLREWLPKPLTILQSKKVATHISSRFLSLNNNEWRAYNLRGEAASWPLNKSSRKILLLPGSRNEVWGHPDWTSAWGENTRGFDAVIDHLGLETSDMVLRCHPNWAENIGSMDGNKPEQFYQAWAKNRNVFCIPSSAKISTFSLINECDFVISTGGSSALDAGALGKQVITVAPSCFSVGGFTTLATNENELLCLQLDSDLDKSKHVNAARERIRKTLRYSYSLIYRIPQYVNFVKCVNPTKYRYLAGANPERFDLLLSTGNLEADDDLFDGSEYAENEIISIFERRDWLELYNKSILEQNNAKEIKIQRRFHYGYLDRIRSLFPVGDR